MADSAISDELRRCIGVETPPCKFVVEHGAARRFLAATGDNNPLYCDEAWARTTKYGSLLAPPTFFCPDAIITSQALGLPRPRPFPHNIDGGTAWELYAPLKVGQTVSLTAKVVDMYEKQGSSSTGRMVFSIIEVACRDERGELVALARGTSISYEGSREQ